MKRSHNILTSQPRKMGLTAIALSAAAFGLSGCTALQESSPADYEKPKPKATKIPESAENLGKRAVLAKGRQEVAYVSQAFVVPNEHVSKIKCGEDKQISQKLVRIISEVSEETSLVECAVSPHDVMYGSDYEALKDNINSIYRITADALPDVKTIE